MSCGIDPRRQRIGRKVFTNQQRAVTIRQRLDRSWSMGIMTIYGHGVMTRIEFVIQPMREGIALPGERIWNGTFMKKRDMIRLLEGVLEELPVGTQLRLP